MNAFPINVDLMALPPTSEPKYAEDVPVTEPMLINDLDMLREQFEQKVEPKEDRPVEPPLPPTAVKPEEIDPELKADIKAYLACQLGNKSFQKEFTLLGGQLKALFQELSIAEARVVRQEIDNAITAGTITTVVSHQYQQHEYRMLAALCKLEINEKSYVLAPVISTSNLPEKRDKVYSTVEKEAIYTLLLGCWSKMEDLVNRLEEVAELPDFTVGIETCI